MNQRAQALARVLISRLRQFERDQREQGGRDERKGGEQRRKLVEKILFTEVGLTDYAKAQLVAVAVPRLQAGQETDDRDLRELAEFLDAHLDWGALTP
jgi:hypothetical protein